MFVSISGKAGAGKDTIADYLIETHGYKKISLADPIKRLVKDIFVLSDHTVYDRVAREQPLPQWNGWTVRKLLQIIGTELFRKNIDEDIWVKSLIYRVREDPNSNYVCADTRFPNELAYLKNNCKNFISIKVTRDGCDGNVGIKGHESEAYDLETDFVINNNGNFQDLYNTVEEIIQERKIGIFQRLYNAVKKMIQGEIKMTKKIIDHPKIKAHIEKMKALNRCAQCIYPWFDGLCECVPLSPWRDKEEKEFEKITRLYFKLLKKGWIEGGNKND